MKLKHKAKDLIPARDLKEVIQRLPLEFRLAGSRPEEIVNCLKTEELKKMKELLNNTTTTLSLIDTIYCVCLVVEHTICCDELTK